MTPSPNPGFVSPRKRQANRRNAEKSTGPRTEKGKQRSRLNGRRHDLTGQVSILPDTERAAVEAFCGPIIADLAPGNDFEMQLARDIAESQWRLNRVRAMEDNFFAAQAAYEPPDPAADGHPQIEYAFHQARAFSENPRDFDRLSLYEQRIKRGMEKSFKIFHQAKKERLALAARESETKANGGFPFSTGQIDASITPDPRLEQARNPPPGLNFAKAA